MNALRLASSRSSLILGRRFGSSVGPAPAIPKPPVPEMYHYNLKKAWFSDPSTYPLLFCLAVAGSFIVGMTVNAFTYYKDIKINPTNKQKIVRDWGNQPQRTVTQSFAGQHYHTKPEGLGIDHAEWAKKKSAAEN